MDPNGQKSVSHADETLSTRFYEPCQQVRSMLQEIVHTMPAGVSDAMCDS